MVRSSDLFDACLKAALPEERPGNGKPSIEDFKLLDMPAIVAILEQDFEASTVAYPQLGDRRKVLHYATKLVGEVAIVAELVNDDTVELVLIYMTGGDAADY